MVKFINSATGSEMFVHESRVEEYKAAGHKLAAAPKSGGKKKAQKTQEAQEAQESQEQENSAEE